MVILHPSRSCIYLSTAQAIAELTAQNLNLIPTVTMSFLQYKQLIEEGDTVIICRVSWPPPGAQQQSVFSLPPLLLS